MNHTVMQKRVISQPTDAFPLAPEGWDNTWMDKEPKTPGEVLRALMDQCLDETGEPISQNRMAKDTESGVSQSTISRILQGTYPDRATVLALANYFVVTPAQMRGEEPIDWQAEGLRRATNFAPTVTQPGTDLRRYFDAATRRLEKKIEKTIETKLKEQLARYTMQPASSSEAQEKENDRSKRNIARSPKKDDK